MSLNALVTVSVNQTVQTQNLFDLTLDGNTSGVLALVSSGTLTLAGGNNITLSQAGNAVTISAFNQTVQTQNLIDLSLSGNTSGALALISSGTAILAGGNNVTLSQNGQSITISAFNQTVQTQNAVDLSLSGNTSGTLALISSGTAILAGGNNVTLSQVGQSITISAAAQTVQTQNLIDVTLSGNTSGTLALVSSGTLTLAGGNNVTLSQVGNAVTISAFNQTVQTQNLLDLSLSGNTSGTLALISSGTAILAGGNNITLSQNGQSVTISAFNQTVQTQNLIDVTLSGNTSGTLALISSGTMTLAGGNNITLSQVGNAVTISGPNIASPIETVGISNLGNTSGTSGVVTGPSIQFILAGGNNITLSQSTNGVSATVTISAFTQTVQTQGFLNSISLIGNTSGTTSAGTGSLVLAGGNNITLSASTAAGGMTVTISAFTQTVQTQGFLNSISLIGNTSGTTSAGTGSLILAGGNNITLSASTAAGGITVTVSGAAQTVESQSAGISNLGNTSGTSGIASGGQIRFLLAGGNNITLSQSVNGASATVTISAFTQTVQTQGFLNSISLVGNTSGTTSAGTGSLVLAGGNNITLSASTAAGGMTVTVSAFTQSAESQSAGISNLGNTSGTSGIASGAQIRLLLAGGNNVTLSQSVNGASATVTISAFNQTVESQSLGMSNIGNTSGTTGIASGGQVQFLFAGGNNITLSQSLNGASGTITVIGAAGGTGAATMTIGMSTGGNTSGNTAPVTASAFQYVFAGGNNITLSQSTNGASGTLTISAFNQTVESQTAGISNLGNTAGTSGVASGGQIQLILAGGNNVTLSQSVNGASATVTVNAAPILSMWANFTQQPAGINISGDAGASDATAGGVLQVHPIGGPQLIFPGRMTVSTANLLCNITSATSVMSQTFTMSFYFGIYTQNGLSLSLLNSVSTSLGFAGAATNNSTGFAGPRFLSLHSSQWSAQPVFDVSQYWLAYFHKQNGGSQGTYSIFGSSLATNNFSGTIGASQSTGTTKGLYPFYGAYSATTASFPANIQASQLSKTVNNHGFMRYVLFNNSPTDF